MIHIVTSAEKYNYIELVSLIKSALLSKKKESRYIFHVLSDELEENDLACFKNDIEIHFYKVGLRFQYYDHFTETYGVDSVYKIFIPWIIRLNKVLYIDAGAVVKNDLTELYNIPFNGKYILAPPEKNRKDFINVGVTLYNIDKIRKRNSLRKKLTNLIDNSVENGLKLYEEDVINKVYKKYIGVLPIKYGYSPILTQDDLSDEYYIKSEEPVIYLYPQHISPYKDLKYWDDVFLRHVNENNLFYQIIGRSKC